MASPRPKSPRPAPISAKKEDKEESFWDKIGTLGRKKRIKEGEDGFFVIRAWEREIVYCGRLMVKCIGLIRLDIVIVSSLNLDF